MSIIEKLKALRMTSGLPQKRIALELDITQGAYSLIENGQNSLTVENLLTLSELYGVSTDHILCNERNLMPISPENGFMPFIGMKDQSGFIKNGKDGKWLAALQMYRIPGYDHQKNLKLFEVSTDIMAPTLIRGDILIAEDIEDLTRLEDGSLTVAVTPKYLTVGRMKKNLNGNCIILGSDTPYHTDIRFPLKNVISLLSVKGRITSSTFVGDPSQRGHLEKLEGSLKYVREGIDRILTKLNDGK